MGDRGNIKSVSRETPEGIYFYSHWGGTELPLLLQSALERGKSRWGDEQYLNRIIFCEMIEKDTKGLTGFGISTYECDNEHAIITVHNDDQTVSFNDSTWPFSEYIELSKEVINKAFFGEDNDD
jgi:hypothetical protein